MNSPIRTWTPGLGATARSLSYGDLPSRAQYDTHYNEQVGDGVYQMELVGDDAAVANELIGEPQYIAGRFNNKAGYDLDRDELWSFLEELSAAWARGDEAAGDLASGILSTLDFEWI